MKVKGRSGLLWVGLGLVAFCVGITVFGPFISPYGPTESIGRPFSAPGAYPPFGLDYLGRDVASRLLWGGRTALFLALVATVLGLVIALVPGLLAAFHRGWVDMLFNRVSEVLLSFPIIVLVLLLVTGFGTSLWLVVAAVAIGHAPRFARLIRGSAMTQRDLGYVEVGEARGESSLYLTLREILPNLIGPLGVEFGVRLATSVALLAGLSFLGVGVQPPAADWGLMISENRNGLLIQPWVIMPSVLIIGMFTVGVNLIIDGVGHPRRSVRSRHRRWRSLSAELSGRRDGRGIDTGAEGLPHNGSIGDHPDIASLRPIDAAPTEGDRLSPYLEADAVLQVRNLTVRVDGSRSVLVNDVTVSVGAGEVLAVVGESGSGKTTLGLAVMGYARPGTYFSEDASVKVAGRELLALSAEDMQHQRLESLGFVAQDPASSLSPGMRIGRQIGEVLEAQGSMSRDRIDGSVRSALEAVHLPSGDGFLARYPHELSGGQQQRVVIAMALIRNPSVIVLDEPTTALDVTTQRHILELLDDLIREHDIAVLYISHDLSVVRHIADRGGRHVRRSGCPRGVSRPALRGTRPPLPPRPAGGLTSD